MPSFARYILSQLVVAMLMVAGVLTGLVVLIRSLRLIDFVINLGVTIGSVFELTLLLTPSILGIILPIALFAAVTFTYSKLISDQELVVMRAAGVSQFALARPALQLALATMLIGYAINLYLAPLSYRHFKDQQNAFRNDFVGVSLREGRFNTPLDGITVYFRARNNSGELQGILVHDKRNPERPITWMAERGVLVTKADTTQIVMFNGNRQEVDESNGQLSLVDFDQGSMDLEFLDQASVARWHDPKERYLPDLLFPGDSANDLYYANDLIAEGHRRLAAPLFSFAFAMIALAALLTGDVNRRGQTPRVLAAIACVVVFQFGGIGITNLAAKMPGLLPLIYATPLTAILCGAYLVVRRPRRPRAVGPLASVGQN